MGVSHFEHKGRGAQVYQSAREYRDARSPYPGSPRPSFSQFVHTLRRARQPSPDYPSEHPFISGKTDSYVPNYADLVWDQRPLCKHRLSMAEGIKEESDLEEGELPLDSDDSCPFRDEETSSSSANIFHTDPYFLDRRCKMSVRMENPRAISNFKQRQFHIGKEVEKRFNTNLTWVLDIMSHMTEQYDCLTVYDYGLLRPGDIIYYLRAFFDEFGQLKSKGRFAVVVDVFDQCAKVADMYTFNGQGLAPARPQHVWYEYVGLFSSKFENYSHPSREEPLELGWACCEMLDTTSVYLRTGRVTLGDNIMLAGYVTKESLSRLREMIKKIDN